MKEFNGKLSLTNQEVKNMYKELDFKTLIGGIAVGSIITILIANVVFKDYREVHQTNIGGVVIEGKHIYELVELSDPSQGVVRK
jgi:hypothetical protein